MANKTFETYFGERIEFVGSPPVQGLFYLVDNDSTIQKTTFGLTGGFAQGSDDATVTTIATVDTWTDISNTLTQEVITPNLVFAANEFTYVGENSIAPVQCRASMSFLKTGGIAMVYKICIAVNGTPVISSTSVSADGVDRSYVSVVWYEALQQNDTVKMMVKNVSGSDDLQIVDAQLSIG